MASLVDRLRRYLSSPQGQKIIREGQRHLNDPRNRQRVERVLNDPRNRQRIEGFLARWRKR